MDYLYDGSFDGFLTCVHRHYYAKSPREKAEGIFVRDAYRGDLVRAAAFIETDAEKANAVNAAIAEKISGFDLERIYHVFCTETPEKEMKLLRYIRLGFRRGPGVGLLHGDPIVFEIQKAQRRLGTEVNRLCGLIRFSVVHSAREILYARIEPDNDVLEFLAPHFTDRFHSDPFIIHDLRRSKALISYGHEWYITELADEGLFERAADEDEIRALWRGYFDAMAIRERINPRCQRNMMPARYWKHLIEMRGE
ncbi:MAG: TIGR03915 family putative DNA repair protein [Clostridiales Family XIII bacterium]|jgi:probable DNA metabolism protein|nr:TIGR03915 family putative DNA repair protein [Clostridiales Family XIII bacterium]